MAYYLIDGHGYTPAETGFQDALEAAYARRQRPVCLCRQAGVPMYLSKVGEKVHLKRMPNHGADHSAWCDSFEPPPELGGLGQVLGSAIQDDLEQGVTTLALGFSFTKGPPRKAPEPGDKAADSVKAERSRLSLLGMLHYLWEEAGLGKWSPGMAGKRSWPLVRRLLQQAAHGKQAKGAPLEQHLYIPEPFTVDLKEEISRRRGATLAPLMTQGAVRGRPLMMLVGEVKELSQARYGKRVVVKHCPEFPFYLSVDTARRLESRFATPLSLWEAYAGSHLMMIAMFSVASSGAATIEEASLMLTSEQWLPLEDGLEALLLRELVAGGRRFVRSLRYNLPANRPIAFAVLHDTAPTPTALFIRSAGAAPDYEAAIERVIETSPNLGTWVWDAATGAIPELPPKARANPEAEPTPFRPIYLRVVDGPPEVAELVVLKPPRRTGEGPQPGQLVAAVDRVLNRFDPAVLEELDVAISDPGVTPAESGTRLARLAESEARRLTRHLALRAHGPGPADPAVRPGREEEASVPAP